MLINKWNRTKTIEAGMMMHVSKTEAYKLIHSLSEQLLRKSSNSGRAEFVVYVNNEKQYFSVAVDNSQE